MNILCPLPSCMIVELEPYVVRTQWVYVFECDPGPLVHAIGAGLNYYLNIILIN